jgi:predicted TIM-barrel fold metal-dependent hydrolase
MTDGARRVCRFDALLHVTRSGAWPNGRDDAGIARLIHELDRGEVARGCLVGLPGVVDNEYVLACAAGSGGRLVPIAGLHPHELAAEPLRTQLRTLADAGFRGVKLHPRLGGYDPLDPRALDVVRAAGDQGLVVFLDTLFRQSGRATGSAPDVIDRIVTSCPDVRMVLLHGGGPQILEVAQVVKIHSHLLLDLSYTLMAFCGSSVDLDLAWILRNLDRRVVVGSDMPEYTPSDAFGRLDELMRGMPETKHANVTYENLAAVFGP